MKYIKPISVIGEGFRSLSERVEVNLDRPGINLVKGVNGAGKTTLFEIIVWNLFGINLKGTTAELIPTWPEVRTEAFRGTYSEFEIAIDDVKYTIIRTIGWSGGEGIGRDALVIKGQNQAGVHKKDVQAQIVDLLGMDAQTFMSAILFGQRMPKLVESKNTDKRELFERLFEAAFLNAAKDKAKEDIHETIGDEAEIVAELNSLARVIEDLGEAIIEQDRLVTEFELNQEKKRQGLIATIDTTKKEVGYNDEELNTLQGEVDAWDEGKYLLFKKDLDKIEKDFNAMEAKGEAPKLALAAAKERTGNASRYDVVAEANIGLENKRIEKYAIDKAGVITFLHDELKELMNEKAKKMNAIEETCYACGQDLTTKSIAGVRLSIEETYDPQLEGVNTRINEKNAEKPPVSNLAELIITREETIKELSSAGKDQEKAFATLTKFQNDTEELRGKFETMVQEEGYVDQKSLNITTHKDRMAILVNSSIVLNNTIRHTREQLNAVNLEIGPTFEKKIEELEQEGIVRKEELDIIQKKVDDINYTIGLHEWWIKKGLSSAGMPAFVFKAMLDNLNKNVTQYADRLGVSIEFSIDLTKASKPFTTVCSVGNRLNKEYKEFSGGQKQRLDIVLIFAMHDLVSADVNVNMMIMDEVFEGLDEAGEAAVFDLIRMKAEQGKSIYIITHSPHIDSLYSSTMTAIADETGATKIQG